MKTEIGFIDIDPDTGIKSDFVSIGIIHFEKTAERIIELLESDDGNDPNRMFCVRPYSPTS